VKIGIGDVELFFDVDGAQLVPTVLGWDERPTVVLLHAGPGADHSLYKDTIGPPLTRVAQVVYLDQRGDGRSDRSNASRWNLETWTEDLRAFLDALEIERPVLLGSSVGALVALKLAARYPDRPAKLVLTSAAARYSHQRSIAMFDRLGGAAAGEVAARYFGDPSETTFAEYLRVCLPLYTRRGLDPEVVARIEINAEATIQWDRHEAPRVDLREEVGRVTCPVLVLAGEDDPSFTVAAAEELVAALPRQVVEFRRYPSAGHGVFRDAPHAMEDVVSFVLSPSL
jgi:pimeloyl-ACP methyl ester carboxylesterase